MSNIIDFSHPKKEVIRPEFIGKKDDTLYFKVNLKSKSVKYESDALDAIYSSDYPDKPIIEFKKGLSIINNTFNNRSVLLQDTTNAILYEYKFRTNKITELLKNPLLTFKFKSYKDSNILHNTLAIAGNNYFIKCDRNNITKDSLKLQQFHIPKKHSLHKNSEAYSINNIIVTSDYDLMYITNDVPKYSSTISNDNNCFITVANLSDIKSTKLIEDLKPLFTISPLSYLDKHLKLHYYNEEGQQVKRLINNNNETIYHTTYENGSILGTAISPNHKTLAVFIVPKDEETKLPSMNSKVNFSLIDTSSNSVLMSTDINEPASGGRVSIAKFINDNRLEFIIDQYLCRVTLTQNSAEIEHLEFLKKKQLIQYIINKKGELPHKIERINDVLSYTSITSTVFLDKYNIIDKLPKKNSIEI